MGQNYPLTFLFELGTNLSFTFSRLTNKDFPLMTYSYPTGTMRGGKVPGVEVCISTNGP